MSQNKPNNKQIRLRLSQNNCDRLEDMKQLGCDASSIVNLALDLLFPKLENYKTTDEKIAEIIIDSSTEEWLEKYERKKASEIKW